MGGHTTEQVADRLVVGCLRAPPSTSRGYGWRNASTWEARKVLALFYDVFTDEADAADVQEARAVLRARTGSGACAILPSGSG